MVHRSKMDLWIVLIVAAAAVGPIVAGAVLLIDGRGRFEEGRILLLSGVGIAALLGLVAWPIAYEVTPSTLVIRSGLLRARTPLESIDRIRPTWNLLSAPAWSLDRLRIDYTQRGRRRFALVSPKDKAAFLADVARAQPALGLSGDQLARGAAQ